MTKFYAYGTTNAVMQTKTFRQPPYCLSTIWIDLTSGEVHITIREGDAQNKPLAKWLWKLVPNDLKKELREAE